MLFTKNIIINSILYGIYKWILNIINNKSKIENSINHKDMYVSIIELNNKKHLIIYNECWHYDQDYITNVY